MKPLHIVHLVPGSGGSFYCQNCFKDTTLIRELRARGHEVTVIPMYLPSFPDAPALARECPTFFGAINLYLKEILPCWRHAPEVLKRLLDARVLLNLVARSAGSTRAEGLEEMTLSMLRGKEGRQREELTQLLDWMSASLSPDIVHISNALLLGLAPGIRERFSAGIVCSLQDEDHWINAMREEYRHPAWELIGRQAESVDRFVSVSRHFAGSVSTQAGIPREKISVIYAGIDPAKYRISSRPSAPAVIGYLSRTAEGLGLDRLLEALPHIRRTPGLEGTRLHVCGGGTGEDRPFLRRMERFIRKEGLIGAVTITEGVDLKTRVDFLSGLTLLSVPMEKGDAIGTFLLEAFAAGVPVVQPSEGGFSEVMALSGAGVGLAENTTAELTQTLLSLLQDRPRLDRLAAAARAAAETTFSVGLMADQTEEVYSRCRR